jgi:hypothetical protein
VVHTGRVHGRVERALVVLLAGLACSSCAWAGSGERLTASDQLPSVSSSGSARPDPSDSTPSPATPSDASTSPSSSQSVETPGVALAGSARAALARLSVKGRAPRTGYRRAQFGGRWPDVDRNGCDTRNDVLGRDLTGIRFRGSGRCVVASGVLVDPYTGARIDFVRGPLSAEVQIDHVVALGDAWQKGAQGWTAARRRDFANDPLELLAVGGAVNQAKGDGDAATWLPPRASLRCAYVARQIAVKARYGLWVTAAERDAMARILARCPAQPLPTG